MLDVLDDHGAIDTHAHQPTSRFLHDAGGEMMRDAARQFGSDMETATYEEMIADYREAGVERAVLLGWDAETNTGNPPVPNDHVAEVRDDHPGFFVGFGSVDPLKEDAVAEDRRLAAIAGSSYAPLRNRVEKVRAEEDYHRDHAGNWLDRLTEDAAGRRRVELAVERLFPHALTLFEPVDGDESGVEGYGFRTDSLATMAEDWLATVVPSLESLGVSVPIDVDGVDDDDLPAVRGRDGTHTEAWHDLFADMTETYRELDRHEATRIMEDP